MIIKFLLGALIQAIVMSFMYNTRSEVVINDKYAADSFMARFLVIIPLSIAVLLSLFILSAGANTDDILFLWIIEPLSVFFFIIYTFIDDKYHKEKIYTDIGELYFKIKADYEANCVELSSSYFDFEVSASAKGLLLLYFKLVREINGDDIVRFRQFSQLDNHIISGIPEEHIIPDSFHDYIYTGNYATFLQMARNDDQLAFIYRLVNTEVNEFNVVGENVPFIF